MFIVQYSSVHKVLDNIHGMYCDMINRPVVNQAGGLDKDVLGGVDLGVANELLATLERLYKLRVGRSGTLPRSCGFDTPGMLEHYVQMKHWQRMLDTIYGDQCAPEVPTQRENPFA